MTAGRGSISLSMGRALLLSNAVVSPETIYIEIQKIYLAVHVLYTYVFLCGGGVGMPVQNNNQSISRHKRD